MHDPICQKDKPDCLCNTCQNDKVTLLAPCCCSAHCGCPVQDCPSYKKEVQ